jgi:hypothetical protein
MTPNRFDLVLSDFRQGCIFDWWKKRGDRVKKSDTPAGTGAEEVSTIKSALTSYKGFDDADEHDPRAGVTATELAEARARAAIRWLLGRF